jgi:hypothetical protein
LPFTWTAFVFTALTGSALFASHAVGYAHNFPVSDEDAAARPDGRQHAGVSSWFRTHERIEPS